ncbi:uncharacterized protein LOC118272118 isoform X1 [Spodoptera frugiperda]|uniref:Uncharacterized protein LOC118272118 isoform X1 n=1 Tax=Spodoptera frugiperda TaxID=7108 RepID=A0A9R0DMN4_SPOFR|nr:uncharacterized protein LOC118272118 isoform X1 [Spodoptera frugiperda]
MEERLEWSASAMVRLLHEYRQRRELWCKAHPLYREPSTKYESWSDLAAQFECPIAEIRKKLNSIFASYRREKIKIRQGGKTHWFLYDYLKFLPNHVEPAPRPAADSGSQQVPASSNCATESKSGESSDNNEEDDAEAEAAGEEEEEPMEEQEQVIIKEEPSTSETYNDAAVHVQTPPSPASAPSPPSSPAPPAQPRRRGRPRPYTRTKLAQPMKRKLPTDHDSLDDKLVETLKLLKKSELSRKKDECDSFGEYIAMSLRKHDERTQSMIKQAINNILFEQEMRLYSGGQYTVLLTGPEENPLVFEAK